MKIHAMLGVLAIFGLSACQSTGVKMGYYSNAVGEGTELELVKTLQIPAGLARIYLQAGEAQRYGEIDQYRPFCFFLMRDPAPLARDIQPATFVVSSVILREQDVRLATPVRLAHVGLFGGSDGPGVIAYETHMLLQAAGQRSPERLVCSGAFAEPYKAAPIRLEQMRQALGSWVVVRVPGSAGS